MENIFALTIPGSGTSNVIITPPANIPSTLASTGPLSIGGILAWVIVILLIGTTFLAIGYLLYGAMLFMMSQGDKQKITNARRTMVFALIGLIIAIMSVAIVNTLGKLIIPQNFTIPFVVQPPILNQSL